MARSTITKELANDKVSIETALSRLLVIASDIGNDELSKWAENELNGYKISDDIPEYRIVKNGQIRYTGIIGNYQVSNASLPLLSDVQKENPDVFNFPILDSIGTIQNLVSKGEKFIYGRDITRIVPSICALPYTQFTEIKQIVPLNTFTNMISNLKTKLLQIFIKLDKEYGNLDDLDINIEGKSTEEVEKINRTLNALIVIDKSIKIGDKNKIENSDFN